MVERVLQEIRSRQRFVVTSHARPDGDGIGSALACAQILRVMGKVADVVMHDGVPRIYQNLPFADRVIKADRIPAADAVILLECDSTRRTLLDGLDKCFLINIDHHVSGRNFANVNWIDSSVMATAELVFRFARRACVPIDRNMATCLYTALMTDTGSFMFEGTNEHTFTVARELALAGADPALCARSIYFGHSTAKMRLLGAALSNLHREGSLAWIWVTQEQMTRFGAREEDCEDWSTTRSPWAMCRSLFFFANSLIAACASASAAKARSTSRPWPSISAEAVTNAPAAVRSRALCRSPFRELSTVCARKRYS